jgi:hypothetical protein
MPSLGKVAAEACGSRTTTREDEFAPAGPVARMAAMKGKIKMEVADSRRDGHAGGAPAAPSRMNVLIQASER